MSGLHKPRNDYFRSDCILGNFSNVIWVLRARVQSEALDSDAQRRGVAFFFFELY